MDGDKELMQIPDFPTILYVEGCRGNKWSYNSEYYPKGTIHVNEHCAVEIKLFDKREEVGDGDLHWAYGDYRLPKITRILNKSKLSMKLYGELIVAETETKYLVTTKEVIDNWNRAKYPSFQDYMNSPEYQKLVGNDEV